MPKPANARQIAAAQQKFPAGTRVCYWAGAKLGEPTGIGIVEAVPYLFGGHSLCAFIRDPRRHSDHIAVSHLEPVPEAPDENV